jgi:hypothetical protein
MIADALTQLTALTADWSATLAALPTHPHSAHALDRLATELNALRPEPVPALNAVEPAVVRLDEMTAELLALLKSATLRPNAAALTAYLHTLAELVAPPVT